MRSYNSYFGRCPTCSCNDGYLNVGRFQWIVCHQHRYRWCIGSNYFSTWRNETEADWQANWRAIADYTEIDCNTVAENPTLPLDNELRAIARFVSMVDLFMSDADHSVIDQTIERDRLVVTEMLRRLCGWEPVREGADQQQGGNA